MNLYDYKLEQPFVYMSNLQLVYGVRMHIKKQKTKFKRNIVKIGFYMRIYLILF